MERDLIAPGPGESLLEMNLLGGKVFELVCHNSLLTPTKLNLMGIELGKAGWKSDQIYIAVKDQHDIACLPAFHSHLEGKDPHFIVAMFYQQVRVVCEEKVPITEVHFKSIEGDLLGKIVGLKPEFKRIF